MSTEISKPELFIGSSKESIDYARAVHQNLYRVAQVTPWYTAFEANSYTMDALEEKLDLSDFGVFVFAADDVALHRGKYIFITRDNTIFEMGLFWGKLRRKRVFAIIPEKVEKRDDLIENQEVKDFHILSDLQGLTILRYQTAVRDNYQSAVDLACGEIAKAIEREGPYRDPSEDIKDIKFKIHIKQSILAFFYEYNKNTTINQSEKYQALSEAVRNSFLAPDGFRVTGSAIWKKEDDEGIGQVSGNVGKGNFYKFEDYSSENENNISVVEAYQTGQWQFFERKHVGIEYVLCYPLGTQHVVSVHIMGSSIIDQDGLKEIVDVNQELLGTINQIVGGEI